MAKQPPCGSENEQFRDCCIWRDCIEYGKQRKMLFVSAESSKPIQAVLTPYQVVGFHEEGNRAGSRRL